MRTEIPSTREKALKLNLDKTKYGTFAEIGAGQETVGWFFKVGGASGTVAKSISAYDMKMSDAIYGPIPRYVSRDRLSSMLDHEYTLMVERLTESRGQDTTFFAFADTVRARAYKDKDSAECHGWMGIRFQTKPGGPSHEVILHVRMFDDSNLDQQYALGILGVNLVFAACYYREDAKTFVQSLLDDLTNRSMEIDMLKFSGPDFADVDNREIALMLVENNLTEAAFFTSEGEVMQVAEKLYKKPVLVLRGSFNPVTLVHMDMLRSAEVAFRKELASSDAPYIELLEFSMNNLFSPMADFTHQDFLRRADAIQALGKNVLISKFGAFHRLGTHLSRYTQEPIGLVLSLDVLEKLFQESWYEDLPGGILESFGRLFKNALRLYVYPVKERESGAIRSVEHTQVAPYLIHLFRYLKENRRILGLEGSASESAMNFWTTDIRRMLEEGDPQWTKLVPPEVARLYGRVRD